MDVFGKVSVESTEDSEKYKIFYEFEDSHVATVDLKEEVITYLDPDYKEPDHELFLEDAERLLEEEEDKSYSFAEQVRDYA